MRQTPRQTRDDRAGSHAWRANRHSEWGCLPGTDTACGVNCCPKDEVCNTTTHKCGSANCNDCGGNCNMNETCDEATCSCVSSSGDGGFIPESCDDKCGCPAGKTCKCATAPLLCAPCAIPGIGKCE